MLRFLGWGFFFLQERQNAESTLAADIQLRRGTGGEFVVLCIGESTTALRGKHAWPVQLQTILNNIQDQQTFRVINKGVPGTSTGVILNELPEYLTTYKPDLVLAMVGLNDFCTEPGSIFCDNPGGLDSIATVTTSDQSPLVNFLNNFRTYELIEWIAAGITTRVAGKAERVTTTSKTERGGSEGILPVYNLIHPNVTHLHPQTIRNLNGMIDITTEQGVEFIFVSYALRKIDVLKDAVKREVIYFSNYEIFLELLEQYDYADLFTDLYGGDFGHATTFGNRVIADNVARQLLKLLDHKNQLTDLKDLLLLCLKERSLSQSHSSTACTSESG